MERGVHSGVKCLGVERRRIMSSLNTTAGADRILRQAMAILHAGDSSLLRQLDDVPAPLYVTDSAGYITYFNSFCIDFSGRIPATGKDRWCVSWKLYTDDGEPLPHDQCPMADALRRRCAVRGLTAIAERPDGSRVRFMPFPTPLFAADGAFEGAVNMLIDITEPRQADDLRDQAARFRRLAAGCGDRAARKNMERMATEYEVKASAFDLLILH
jgi:PAS domain-containing protein